MPALLSRTGRDEPRQTTSSGTLPARSSYPDGADMTAARAVALGSIRNLGAGILRELPTAAVDNAPRMAGFANGARRVQHRHRLEHPRRQVIVIPVPQGAQPE
jgi:hypothetical protein